MSNIDEDALSTVEAYHQAWTSGDVDRALTYLSDDVRCFAPDENVTTKGDWHQYAQPDKRTRARPNDGRESGGAVVLPADRGHDNNVGE